MNLQPIAPPDQKEQRVNCFRCGIRVDLKSCMADLDGPAFKAYYCPGCVGPHMGIAAPEAPGTSAEASYYVRFGFHGTAFRSAP